MSTIVTAIISAGSGIILTVLGYLFSHRKNRAETAKVQNEVQVVNNETSIKL